MNPIFGAGGGRIERTASLVHELLLEAAHRVPDRTALVCAGRPLSYREFADAVVAFARRLGAERIGKGDRVAVYSEKRHEAVAAMLGASCAGAVFVPVNPMLKAAQVVHILRDCNVRILVTTADRLALLRESLAECPDLHSVCVIGGAQKPIANGTFHVFAWGETPGTEVHAPHRTIDGDVAAILYTSGSTGKPKGVVLSHRNIVAGAKSVAEYLELTEDDRLLSVLPLSFDYGLNQLTTSFLVGAQAVLLNHLFARDVVNAVAKHRITGLAAVPPLWIELAELTWPDAARESLRYFTNSGGAMPRETLARLRAALPKTRPFLMYGLTEAFRSTFLPPDEIDRRPGSIGKAIPNAEVMVVRPDGTPCAPSEPGELVHRGVHVSLGYWNDVEKTAERFKLAPGQNPGLVIPELAVWSGDTVRTDEDGYIYFVGRRDEMIKTSGFRVSPTEVEEVLYATGLVGEAAAFGVKHARLGEAIIVVVTAAPGTSLAAETLRGECQKRLPAYMVPQHFEIVADPLPRNPNGKIDRKLLATERLGLFAE